MQHISRILLALTVLLSGVALVPFVELPAETFEWQRYAGVYEEPELGSNYSYGQPGSFFHFSGSGLSPNSMVVVSANGNDLGNLTTDDAGNLEFNLDTTGADLGSYYIAVEQGNVSLTERIILSLDAPLHPQEGTGTLLIVPAGIGLTELYLPILVK
jgi:hypothetical protein